MKTTRTAPNTHPRARIWEDKAARIGKGDLFLPRDENQAKHLVKDAKKICNTCPVKTICLDTAMAEEGAADRFRRAGVRGGLTPAERARLYRTTSTAETTDPELKAAIEALLRKGKSNPAVAEATGVSVTTVLRIRESLGIPPVNVAGPIYDTPEEAVKARSEKVRGGHVEWSGSPYLKVRGVRYTAKQFSFKEAHGRAPVGRVIATCDHPRCIAGAHHTDAVIRDRRDRRNTTKAKAAA